MLAKAGGCGVQRGSEGFQGGGKSPFVEYCRGMSKGCSHPWVPLVFWGESTAKYTQKGAGASQAGGDHGDFLGWIFDGLSQGWASPPTSPDVLEGFVSGG